MTVERVQRFFAIAQNDIVQRFLSVKQTIIRLFFLDSKALCVVNYIRPAQCRS